MKLYQTRAGSLFQAQAINVRNTLDDMHGSSLLEELSPNVFGLNLKADESIGHWEHPVYSVKHDCVYIDIRSYMNRNNEIRDKNKLTPAILRAELEYQWINNQEDFENYLGDVSSVFATWLSNAMRRSFAISELDVARVKVTAVGFYVLNFLTEDKLSHTNTSVLASYVIKIATRSLRIPIQLVEEVTETEDFKVMLASKSTDVDILVRTLDGLTETPLGDITFESLIQLVVPGAWAGLVERQIPAIMFQHPPSLMFMMERFQSVGIYRKTGIGIAIESLRRQIDVDRVADFVRRSN